MKISYRWLKQFIKIDWEAEKAGELLTDLGLEVEGIQKFESVKGSLEGIVTGKVIECTKHPNADKLKLTRVDIGNGTPLQIVCGAPNVAEGQIVPVATIGTTLYDDKGEAWQIKKGKIRGEVSEGMICAEDELGLGDDHDGIMVLSEDIEPGIPCAEIFEIEKDEVFEIGLTPNRADAMSHYGVARDLRAGLIQQGQQPELITPSVSSFHVDNRTLRIEVDVKDKNACPRYCGVTLNGIKVQESPEWLKNRLKSIGLTPKNNVVDITNYVMHELGQPLHAFDAAKITGNKIEVKTLTAGTKFTTLDEVERELHEDDLMICDTEKPLCIAGVFGGLHSGVTQNTTQVFLESAYFDPVSIRKTAKRHALNTDASFRYERGIDIDITRYALQRAALLIKELAGGEISSEIEEFYPVKFEDFQVFLTFEKIYSLIGQEIPTDIIKRILSSLEIKINNVTETGLGLTIPSYRVDVKREADVIEEILRVYGYNNIEFSSKISASIAPSSPYEAHKVENIAGNQLVAQGFSEIMTNSLTTPAYSKASTQLESERNVEILNPLSGDLSVMRQTLLFGGLEALSYNINRRNDNLKFFEFGKSYQNINDKWIENQHLGIFMSGKRHRESWIQESQEADFFYLKGVIDGILERLGIEQVKNKPLKSEFFSEGLTYSAGKTTIAEFGSVRSEILKLADLKQTVLYADLKWDRILDLVQNKKITFSDIPRFPEVKRDLALLVDKGVGFDEIREIAFQTERKLLKSVNLFDVYEGEKLPDSKKSYAVSFILRDDQKTLTDKQIDKVMQKLQQSLQTKIQAELR
ncbi:phenylalanine--tRNA ligase subunit beta [Robertkochia aurantiaca]|uniref:phenylalanine--tRNA ligase subunit beta n=1 Tax=Robertkochia aurantiaca TaxID=2873700 RepID=UPI001CCD29A3|nr:phenylalanine--tRNA ligase subunit beta [Robertkochia sp. 3YJGBD-33]